MMHSLLQVPAKSAVFGRFCFALAYRDRSETYRQRNINSKHTVPAKVGTSILAGLGEAKTMIKASSNMLTAGAAAPAVNPPAPAVEAAKLWHRGGQAMSRIC